MKKYLKWPLALIVLFVLVSISFMTKAFDEWSGDNRSFGWGALWFVFSVFMVYSVDLNVARLQKQVKADEKKNIDPFLK